MTDVLTRLRQKSWCGPLHTEAADEIDRLRALLVRHDECAALDEECGQDTKWTPRFIKLVADTRAALSTNKGGGG